VPRIGAHGLGIEVADKRLTLLDQAFGKIVKPLEIIRSPAHSAVPFESQPADVLLNGQRVFIGFLFRIGVIEAQVASALIVLRQPEIQADGFGVANVQIAVGLGRKSGGDDAMLARGQIVFNDSTDKVLNDRGVGHGETCEKFEVFGFEESGL
jgi:hypothetical protein